jgi:hypothetical protein
LRRGGNRRRPEGALRKCSSDTDGSIIDFNALGRIVEKAILEARQEMLEAMQNVPVWGMP